jgi:hypothetical protein
MTLPPLPPPDTHCWDEDTSKDVWSYSDEAMRTYAEQAVAAERERCAKLADEYATYGGSNFAAWFTKLAAAIRA